MRLPLLELLPEPLGELVQLPQVHFHAGALHLREHLGQRLLHVVVEMLPVGELVEDLAAEEDEGGRLAGAGGRGLLGRLVEQRARPGLRRGLLQFDVEVAPREDVHGVALLRVDEVVHQRNVEPAALEGDARVGEEVRLQLEVVAVFVDGRVLQDGPDDVQPVSGDGAGLVFTAKDKPLDGSEDAFGICLGNEAAAAGLLHGLDHLVRRDIIDNEFLSLLRGRRRPHVRDEALEGVELVFLEEVRDGGGEVHVQPHVLRRRFQRDVGLDGHELLGQADIAPRLLELRLLARGELGQMGIDVLDAAVLGNQLPGAHLADALDARHVVGRVAADGEHVDDLDRVQDAPFLADGRAVDDLVVPAGLPRLVLEHMLRDELAVVLVGRDHVHVHPFPRAAEGHRADHVIGLEPLDHQHGDVHRLHQLRKGFQRVDDKLRSRRACTLVFGVQLVAEGPARRVEGHRQVRGLLPLHHLQQVLREPVQDGHVRPLRVDHRPSQEGVVHLEDERVSVNEKQFVHI